MASKDLQQPQPQAVQAKETAKDPGAFPRRTLNDHVQTTTRNEDSVTQGGSLDTVDGMQSIRDGEAEGVLSKAGTPPGATYSPFRLLPPTPPQSLYPRTSSQRMLEPKAARNVAMMEDRLVSTDRYRGNGLMLHCVPASERPTEGFRQSAQAVERYPRRTSTAAGGGGRMRYYGETGGLGGDPREDDDVLGKVDSSSSSSRDEGMGDDSDREEEGQRQENNRVAQIAEGLLWVQKHPVLAAVVWLAGKVLVPGSEDSEKEGEGAESTTEEIEGKQDGSQTSPEEAFDDIGRGASSWRSRCRSGNGSHDELKERRSGSSRPWERTSKGRLSWSDDFGGSLAEYYEDDRVRLPSDSSSIQDDNAHSDPYPSTTATVLDSDTSGYIGDSHGSSNDDAALHSKQGANNQSNTSSVDPGRGCAAMVNSDTFYANMNEAMRGQELKDGKFSTGTKSGRNGHAIDNLGFPQHTSVPPSTAEGFTDFVSVGESPSVAGGTWSPQWGWYVTMTPPQDMYATPQAPVADSKTSTNSTMVGVNTPSLIDGRPPRP